MAPAVPESEPVDELEALFREINGERLARTFPPGSANYEHRLGFALGRLREGRRIAEYLRGRYPHVLGAERPGRAPAVLDVGSGNGGMLLPWAAGGAEAWGLDLSPRQELPEVARKAGLPGPVHAVTGRGESLPFPDDVFDLVLLVETLEHLDRPRAVGREIVRVLRPGGLCYVVTPARLRFLFAPDPHEGIRGLLLLPDRLQAWLFDRLDRGKSYDVVHTYWTVAGILRTLPGLEMAEITSKHWAGPLRRFDWDWIVARKPG